MRDILFRGNRVDNGEWVYGYLWIGADHSYITPHNLGISYDNKTKCLNATAFEVIPETVSRFTGHTDKNGKMIFEGDICEYHFEELGYQGAVIEWSKKYAAFHARPLNDFQYSELNDCVVIGNIYNNPELLEDGVQHGEV